MKGSVALVLLCGLYALPVHGQSSDPIEEAPLLDASDPVVAVEPAATSMKPTTWALGLAASWANRRDYGNVSRSNFMPEITVQHYRHLVENVFVRPGLRMAYAGLVQAEMPKDLQVVERDVSLRAEMAVLHDGPVVPMFSMGVGLILRSVKLSNSGVVGADFDPVSHLDLLPELSVKTGLGIPFLHSALVLEPHVGMRLVLGDDREGLFYGVDATYAWP